MMDVMPPLSRDIPLINRYGAGVFVVSGQEKKTSIILSARGVNEWNVHHFSELDNHSIIALCEQAKECDIFLIGSGESQEFLSPALRQIGREYSIAIDCMDTGAACRTYNVLIGEGRRVMAALVLV